MAVYKVVARCLKTKRQKIKKIYENDIKFELYGKNTALRYQSYYNVEVYKMEDDEYKLVYELKMPQTRQELEKYAEKTNSGDRWVEYRLKQLENEQH